MATARSYVLSVLFFVGLLLVYIGERLVGVGPVRAVLSIGGLLLIVAAIALRALRVSAAGKAGPGKPGDASDRASIEKALLSLYLLGAVGLVLYAVQSDLMNRLLDKPFEQVAPKLAVVLAALWPICIVASLLPVLFAELSYAGMVRAPMVESGRVKEAMYSGLGFAFALVFAFTAVYVATERDSKADLSYFRTAKPGEATRKIIQSLDEPVQVSVFFPPANEVKEQVMEYFSDLQKDSPKLQVEQLDHAVDPAKARELSVSANGAIVVARGARREQLTLGVDLERARGQLRTFDQDFQKRLLQVARGKRVVYFTAGHGERGESINPGAPDARPGLAAMKELLGSLNLETRNLSAAEGLASDVPKDAAAVYLVGPTKALLEEEAAALVRYVKGGGRLFVAVDPEGGEAYQSLFAPLGVRFVTTPLANDQVYLKRSSQVSDRANIATASFTSHPAVTTLGQYGGRAPVALLSAGSFEVIQPKPGDVALETTVRAQGSTFNDLNGNFQHDPPLETRKAYDVEVAVSFKPEAGKKEEGRALLLADSDAVSDLVLGNPGNAYLALDAMKWLSGDEAIAGSVSNESDVPIEHTRKQDVAWFYSTIFLAPGLVLLAGFLVTRRRRPRARRAVPTSSAVPGGAR